MLLILCILKLSVKLISSLKFVEFNDIKIYGSKIFSKKDIIENSSLNLPTRLISIRTKFIEKELKLNLSLENVLVSRQVFPFGLKILIKTRIPIAYGEKLLDGKKISGFIDKNGFFINPTIFCDVKPDMKIAKEEIFGPVISVIDWENYEEMVKIANSTQYGLTTMIVTNSLSNAMKTAEDAEVGYVWVNTAGRYSGAPYGGWKLSGIGVEECFDEMKGYARLKNINMKWD